MSLYDSIINSLHSCKGRWPEIAIKAGVSYSWLCKVASGAIPDPRIKNMEKVAAAMKTMKLYQAKTKKDRLKAT